MPDITVQDLIRQEAGKQGVPPALALAVAEQESGFNPTVIGPKLPSGEQAIGTFQVLPSTAKTLGFDPNDPVQNIRGGVGYLRKLLDDNNGDLDAVLKTYGGVKTDTDYVPGVLGRLKKFQTAPADTQQTAQTKTVGQEPPAVPPPAGASPALKERFAAATGQDTGGDLLLDNIRNIGRTAAQAGAGAIRGAVSTVQGLASPIRKTFGMEPATPPPAETTTAGKVGRFAEQAGEFLLPASAITKTAKAIPVTSAIGKAALVGGEALAQGGAAYGVSKAQGASEGGAEVAAGLSAAAPVVGKVIEIAAPAIRDRAVKQLAQVFSTGLENKAQRPVVQYALKTGDIANPEVAKAVGIVRKAASDTLDLPIQASWGKWMTTLDRNTAGKTAMLKEALDGPFGKQEVPKELVVKALDDLEASTKHFAEIPGGEFTDKTFNAPLSSEIAALKDALNVGETDPAGYAKTITVKNLTDLKRTWDDYVYTLSTAGKVGLTKEALITTAMKKAMHAGANGIRQALETEAPSVAALNEAVTDAIRLQDLTSKLYGVNPAMGKGATNMARAVGAGVGVAAAHAAGVGGWGGSILGAQLGATTARVVVKAMESPLWQTLGPRKWDMLAKAIAGGNSTAVRQILAPVVAATASQSTVAPAGAAR